MKSRAYKQVRETERVHIRERERPREECLLQRAIAIMMNVCCTFL